MGYRSDVEIAVYGPDDKITALIAGERIRGAHWAQGEWNLHHYKTTYGEPKNMAAIRASYPDVKWYDGYEEVESWQDFLSRIADVDDSDICYEFVRVGEDYEDTVHEHHGADVEWHLTVSRQIEDNFPPSINQPSME